MNEFKPPCQAFDPADRPTCEEALSDPYFYGLAQPQREPAAQPVSKLAFDFERRKLHTEEVGRCFTIMTSESGFRTSDRCGCRCGCAALQELWQAASQLLSCVEALAGAGLS